MGGTGGFMVGGSSPENCLKLLVTCRMAARRNLLSVRHVKTLFIARFVLFPYGEKL